MKSVQALQRGRRRAHHGLVAEAQRVLLTPGNDVIAVHAVTEWALEHARLVKRAAEADSIDDLRALLAASP